MVGTLLEATVKTFLDDRFALDPVFATVMGNHSHDHRLGDFSAAGFAARNELTEDWLRRFTNMGQDSLDPFQKVDRDLVLAELRGDKALHSFERWRRQPSLYSDVITRGAYYTLLRGYSTADDRLAMLAERLAEAPAALDAARANLDPARVPPEWIAIAERTAPAGAAFLRSELPKALPDTSLGRAVRVSLIPAANAAADALDRPASEGPRHLRDRPRRVRGALEGQGAHRPRRLEPARVRRGPLPRDGGKDRRCGARARR
jgi:hypothetical protein